MLALGTALVVAFSDPMVGVMSEMAHRTGVPAFYVAFVLAPVAVRRPPPARARALPCRAVSQPRGGGQPCTAERAHAWRLARAQIGKGRRLVLRRAQRPCAGWRAPSALAAHPAHSSARASLPPVRASCLSPFAPPQSNGAEVLSAYAFSKRKTERATTTSFSTLLGAAVMNNTFCLAIFMALIVARGDLFWEFTAETLAILAVELAMLYYGSKAQHTLVDGVCVGLLYPAGLALVVGLEALGLD
jgi:hypothetical protein